METVRLADVLFIALVCALIWGILRLAGRTKTGGEGQKAPTAGVDRETEDRGRES